MSRGEKISLLVLVIVACWFRLASIPPSPNTVNKLGIFGDERFYFQYAYQLMVGNGFSGTVKIGDTEKVVPAVTRAPGYSIFVWRIMGFWGLPKDPLNNDTWLKLTDRVRYTQCFIDALCCFLIFCIARMVEREPSWMPFLAAFFYAFSPYNAPYAGRILSETLTTFLMTSVFLVAMLALTRQTYRWYWFTGLLLGMLALVRPQFMLCGFGAAFFLLLGQRRNLKLALTRALLLIVGTILMIAPWTLRNYLRFNHFIPISVGSLGQALFLGTVQINEKSWRGWKNIPDDGTLDEEVKVKADALMGSQEDLQGKPVEVIIEKEREFIALALSRMKRKPLTVVSAWFHKMPRLWYQRQVNIYWTHEYSGWLFLLWIVFALMGFILVDGQTRILLSPIWLMILYMFAIFLPLWIEPRYGLPLVPAYLVFASIGVKRVTTRLIELRARMD